MDHRPDIKKITVTAVSVLLALAPVILYFYLVSKNAEGALLFSADGLYFVIAVSVMGALASAFFVRGLFSKKEETVEPFEPLEETEEEKTEEIALPDSIAEEYPELFKRKEESTEEGCVPFAMAEFSRAFEEQKAMYVPEERGEETEPEDIPNLSSAIKEEDRERDMSIYENLPDTLPEGMTCPAEEYEEDGEETEEEETVPEEEKSPKSSVALRLSLTALCIVLTFTFAILSSRSYTVMGEEGIKVLEGAVLREYKWEDVEAYTVAPSFFGGRISITLTFRDKSEAELFPAAQFTKKEFLKKYENAFEYALFATEKMDLGGAEKRVEKRSSIESEFAGSDVYEIIEKIIN